MEEPIPIFESKFAGYLKQLEDDCQSIMGHLRLISEGQARTGYFNDISDRITRMQQTVSALKNLSIKKQLIGAQIKSKLDKILSIAIEQAKTEANKNPADSLGIKNIQ